jgi:micrococcal nuclease
VPFGRLPSLGSLALLAVLLVVLLSDGDDEPEGEVPRDQTAGSVIAEVVDVVDGDTIEVAIRGAVEDVRYIGVDTPETVAPGEPIGCFGPQASHANERLVAGTRVRLAFDEERRDRYGRLLAYVYVEPGGLFVNAELLRRGLARTLTIAPNDHFAARFGRIEQAAANRGRGLWGEC